MDPRRPRGIFSLRPAQLPRKQGSLAHTSVTFAVSFSKEISMYENSPALTTERVGTVQKLGRAYVRRALPLRSFQQPNQYRPRPYPSFIFNKAKRLKCTTRRPETILFRLPSTLLEKTTTRPFHLMKEGVRSLCFLYDRIPTLQFFHNCRCSLSFKPNGHSRTINPTILHYAVNVKALYLRSLHYRRHHASCVTATTTPTSALSVLQNCAASSESPHSNRPLNFPHGVGQFFRTAPAPSSTPHFNNGIRCLTAYKHQGGRSCVHAGHDDLSVTKRTRASTTARL